MGETVKNIEEIANLTDNKIIGTPELSNSTITFNGLNNVLYCDHGVKLHNSIINFSGNNSLIYLSSSEHNYVAHIYVFNNSTVFIGKDNNMSATLKINVQEAQNVIIGDECIFGPEVNIRTSDAFPIFKNSSKKRINMPGSVFIGDHVWFGHLAYISRGAHIGSGAIVYNNSMVLPNSKIKFNSFYIGNPAKLMADEVFFTDFYTGYFSEELTEERSVYQSDVYIYDVVEKETLSFDHVNNILKQFPIDERIDFIKKLFVYSKRKNRFAIK